MSLLQTFMMVPCSRNRVEQGALIVGIGNLGQNVDDQAINSQFSDFLET